MPVQASQPIPASFPSFMSVFGGEDCPEDREQDRKSSTSSQSSYHPQPYPHHQIQSPFGHGPSIATPGLESINSSPTTTISTFDSASVTASTDPSPSSSPESPTSAVATSPFKSMISRPFTAPSEQGRGNLLKMPPTLHNPQPPESPGSSARNVKNLSLNVESSNLASGPAPNVTDPSHPFSAPTSPIKAPLKSGRRKPTNLTIQTPGFDRPTFATAGHSLVPPTPSSRPSLRHFESSPALPSLLSPSLGPSGGMQFPRPTFGRLTSQPCSERSSISNPSSIGRSITETPEEDDLQAPRSQETTERGYTNGPVCIYDSGLYLYLEPNEEEAMKFDVVINVAKEVKNPFAADGAKCRPSIVSIWRRNEARKLQQPSEPLLSVSRSSSQPNVDPCAINDGKSSHDLTGGRKDGPEYIHVPWDHNSEILDDLEPLCELIDARIRAGKTVLVHCQLGVSRSASLVIAYGLYKQYCPDFHSMYTAVKERSRWVGPNMSLIYQLMDFRAKISKQNPPNSLSDNSATVGLKSTTEPEKTPKARPLLMPSTPPPIPSAPRMVSSGTQTDFEPYYSLPSPPAPVSALPPPQEPTARPNRMTPRPLPLREKPLPDPPSDDKEEVRRANVMSRPAVMKVPVHPIKLDLSMQDVPATPSLFSPRATEFMTAPFSRSIAGDLAFTRRAETKGLRESFPAFPGPIVTSREVDPRSPHQMTQGAEIVRSIDDLI